MSNKPISVLHQREQAVGPRCPASSAFAVIPAHGQAALWTTPALFFVVHPLLNVHLTNLSKVIQKLGMMQPAVITEVRNKGAGKVRTVRATIHILFAHSTFPDGAAFAMGGNLAIAETAVATKVLHVELHRPG